MHSHKQFPMVHSAGLVLNEPHLTLSEKQNHTVPVVKCNGGGSQDFVVWTDFRTAGLLQTFANVVDVHVDEGALGRIIQSSTAGAGRGFPWRQEGEFHSPCLHYITRITKM